MNILDASDVELFILAFLAVKPARDNDFGTSATILKVIGDLLAENIIDCTDGVYTLYESCS